MTDLDEQTATAPELAMSREADSLAVRPDAELNLVDGTWRRPGGTAGEIQYNPSTGSSTGWLTYSSVVDLDEAAAAAVRSFETWAGVERSNRLGILGEMGKLIQARRGELAGLIAREVGKPLRDAEREIDMAVALVAATTDERLWASLEERIGDEATRRLPLGVAGGISLYHFPLLSPLWMLLPALAAGNAYVLRPCTWSPLTAVEVARLVEAVGVPRGVFNMIQGSIEVVDAMLAEPRLTAISYVGSGRWAHHMYEHGSRHGKRVQAVGAIRQVHVVLPDADIEAVANQIFAAATEYAGQRWLAGTTVVADSSVVDTLTTGLADAAAGVSIGAAYAPDVALGPVVRPERRDELRDVVQSERKEGRLAFEREAPAGGGFFVGPVISLGPEANDGWLEWRLWEREVPGPILGIVKGDGRDAAALIRRCPQAVVAAVYGPEREAHAVAAALDAGIVAINRRPRDADPRLPSAVWGGTFFGASSWSGTDGLRFFSKPQVVEGVS